MMRLTKIALALLVGCGGGGTAKPNEPTQGGLGTAPAGALELSFQALADGQKPVAMGSTLQSGDRIALSMTVTRPAHIYVIQFFPDGTADVLFPRPGEEKPISGTQRIPATGWFELDKVVGEENVYVVASVEPLAQADASVKRTVDVVRTTGKAPPEEPATAEPATAITEPVKDPPVEPVKDQVTDPPKPPDGTAAPKPPLHATSTAVVPVRTKAAGAGQKPAPGGASLRSRGLNRVEANDMIRVTGDEQGVAVFRFWFKHAAK
jgi:hypothetical protein